MFRIKTSSKRNDNIFYSEWDWITIGIIIFTFGVIVLSTSMVDFRVGIIVGFIFVLIELYAFSSIYYEITNDSLIIYDKTKTISCPIKNIVSIKPTKSIIAAPASSLTKRLEISYRNDKGVVSAKPIIISPSRQQQFINKLISINPKIVKKV